MKKENKIKITVIAVIAIFTICVISANEQSLSLVSGSVSEKTIAWGIKRNSTHEQPDVGASNKPILEENNGICMGNDMDKSVYLTFDSGYEAGYMTTILDTIKENDVKATFFITSHYLNTASEYVERMINEGHIVGNHTPKFLMSGNDIWIKY